MPTPASADTVLLHAAGSLRGALTEVSKAYEAAVGDTVQAKYGPSGLLKDEIAGGAKAEVFASANMNHPRALATAKNCMTCHAVDKKLVGPSYREVAGKYAGQRDAADRLAVKIMKGGSGVWGPVPMPANAQVNEAEAKKLAAWVLTQK